MKISQAFPSKYLKSDEVGANRYTMTIANVMMEDVGDGDKPVIYFSGAQKGMVLNKTNAEMIAYLYGDDTDRWRGQQVELYTTMTSFQGKQMLGLRVCAPPGTQTQRQVLNGPLPAGPAPAHMTSAPQTPPGQPDMSAHEAPQGQVLDDEIPF